MEQSLPFPWVEHLPPITFHANGASACLILGQGASTSAVYVACACTLCAHRPWEPFRAGGRVLGLGDWMLHAGLKSSSLADVQVIHQGVENKVTFSDWLKSESLRIGGESLRRRQVNVFHWNGNFSAEMPSADKRAHPREISAQPTAYQGYGEWRAATIRGYDSTSSRFEVKYHDEPKRSAAHIWLPLSILHFARNPPALAAAIRSFPDRPTEASSPSPADLADDVPLADLIALNRHLELQQQRLLLQLHLQSSAPPSYGPALQPPAPIRRKGSPYPCYPERPASPEAVQQGFVAVGPLPATSATPNVQLMAGLSSTRAAPASAPPPAPVTATAAAAAAIAARPPLFFMAEMAPSAVATCTPSASRAMQPLSTAEAGYGRAASTGLVGLLQERAAGPTPDMSTVHPTFRYPQAANPAITPSAAAFDRSLPSAPRELSPPVAACADPPAAPLADDIKGCAGPAGSGAASSCAGAGAGEVISGGGLYGDGSSGTLYDSPARPLAGYGSGAIRDQAQGPMATASSLLRLQDVNTCMAGLAPSAASFPTAPNSPLLTATRFDYSISGSGCNADSRQSCFGAAGLRLDPIEPSAGSGVPELAFPAAQAQPAGCFLGPNGASVEAVEENGELAALYAEICSEEWPSELPRGTSLMRPEPLPSCLGQHDFSAPLQQPGATAALQMNSVKWTQTPGETRPAVGVKRPANAAAVPQGPAPGFSLGVRLPPAFQGGLVRPEGSGDVGWAGLDGSGGGGSVWAPRPFEAAAAAILAAAHEWGGGVGVGAGEAEGLSARFVAGCWGVKQPAAKRMAVTGQVA